MTYDLHIADRTFSSWSLRGWLMFEKFGLPVRVHMAGLYGGTFADDLAPLAPARLVPVMRTPEGTIVGETLAIAETLAERHPGAGLWPADPAARATARWLVSEMHAGFASLRGACPMQLLHVYEEFAPSEAVRADLDRLETLWTHARTVAGIALSLDAPAADAPAAPGSDAPDSPWLFGAYSLADVFFAPVAARIAGYDLAVSPRARAYVDAHLADPAFRAWRAEGLKTSYDPVPYAMDLPTRPWPA